MKEEAWVDNVKELLQQALSSNFKICTGGKLPYTREIWTYVEDDGDFSPAPDGSVGVKYETDLLIYEEVQTQVKPRVIIEAKYSDVTTHDAIAYSHKAHQHKAVTPYLRYGIMLGGMGQKHPLPGRLFRHGVNFDFMISFKEEKLTSTEEKSLVELIKSEWNFSKQIEEMLSENRSRTRNRYFMLQNALRLKEIVGD
jgi:hypothetical protein